MFQAEGTASATALRQAASSLVGAGTAVRSGAPEWKGGVNGGAVVSGSGPAPAGPLGPW